MISEEKRKALDVAMESINKTYGKGSVMKLGDDSDRINVETFSTGCFTLDRALGNGIPKGRIIEIYGPESCLAEDTFIQYELRTLDEKRINHKGGTISHLYERFHNLCEDERCNKINRDNIAFYISSINENNRVIKQPIADVKKCGVQKCYRISTKSGKTIEATANHNFYIGNGEYKELKDLKVNDLLYIHDNIPSTEKNNNTNKGKYKEILVKYHPSEKYKIITANDKNGNAIYEYTYCRLDEHQLVMEAYLNGFTPDEYRNILNFGDKKVISNFITINRDILDIHHLDCNPTNNDITNLQLLPKSIHYKLHAKTNIDLLSFVVIPDSIISIEEIGEKETYDIKCFAPYNNYIANNIVVHNCGKTTISLHMIAEVQKNGGVAGFIDAEHALDPAYAKNIGVDINELYISQPDCGEQALEICEKMVRSGAMDIIVIDSVAALVPRAEIDGDMGDSHMGLQARLMSQALRKLTSIVSQTKCTVVFINQIREKMVLFGNPETTCGGNALKFYSSIRMDVRRKDIVKKDGEASYNKVKIKIVKNKIAPPFKEVVVDMTYGKGIDTFGCLVDALVENDIIHKAGAWFSYNGENIAQGRDKLILYLTENENLLDEMKEKLNTLL